MARITEASIHQLHIIKSIAEATWPVSYADMISPQQMSYMLEWMYNESNLSQQISLGQRFLLYEEQSNFIGFAGFGPKTEDASIWRLEKLYILPDHQNKGIGKSLLMNIEQIALEEGAEKIELNVNRNNKALRFYQHLGFEIIHSVDLDIGGGFFMNDYILQKSIQIS